MSSIEQFPHMVHELQDSSERLQMMISFEIILTGNSGKNAQRPMKTQIP